MKKTLLLLIFILFQNTFYGQRVFYFEKDIDYDKVIDTVFLDNDKSVIICKLSSNDFKRVETKEVYIYSIMTGIIDSRNGFKYANLGMRARSVCQFRYDKK